MHPNAAHKLRGVRGGSIELTTLETIIEEEDVEMQLLQEASRFDHLDDMRRGWLRRPENSRDMQRNRLGWRRSLCLLVVVLCLIGLPLIIVKAIPKHKRMPSLPDNYDMALHEALLFFDAQKSGRLPINNSIPWRGNSGLQDGVGKVTGGLVGGYYDAGNNMKCHFPLSFAMTMLSWSVLEYEHKYHSAGEYDHIRDLIKWGTDYILLTFDSGAPRIDKIYSQVGWRGDGSSTADDQKCWERPEDMDYSRPIQIAYSGEELGAEMAAALAAASIVFKDETVYSNRLIQAAKTVYSFALDVGKNLPYAWYDQASYRSTGYEDEHMWGATWIYYATGDFNYLALATEPLLAKKAKAVSPIPNPQVLSWDNKLPAAMLLLTRLRIFLGHGYPYEEMMKSYHQTIDNTMCSYLREFHFFNFTPGGLIELNKGDGQPLQYVVNSAFLASLYGDYMRGVGIPGWYCGDSFIPRDTLTEFAASQIRYILGANPLSMSYIVGYSANYPRHVHHRGASIPNDGVKYSCLGGSKWRDNPSPNPNTINGAMVGGPDKLDKFKDVRENYSYTEPTLTGNAGLVAALVSLTSTGGSRVDRNTIFSSIPPLFEANPPPPQPWRPIF